MVETPMFCLCDVRALEVALTACLSGTAPLFEEKKPRRCTMYVNVSACGRSWHTASGFQIFMVRTCCEKKGARQEHVHVHMRTGESPSGTNLHHWMLHIFIEHISCEKIASVVSLFCSLIGQNGKTNRLLPILCFDTLMKPNTTEKLQDFTGQHGARSHTGQRILQDILSENILKLALSFI